MDEEKIITRTKVFLEQLRDPIRLSFCLPADAVLIKDAADAIEELDAKNNYLMSIIDKLDKKVNEYERVLKDITTIVNSVVE